MAGIGCAVIEEHCVDLTRNVPEFVGVVAASEHVRVGLRLSGLTTINRCIGMYQSDRLLGCM